MADPEKVRVTHIVTNPSGGAGRAACRLHEGLVKIGFDSTLLAARPASDVTNVIEFKESKRLADRAPRWFRRKHHTWRGRGIRSAPQPIFEQFSLDSYPAGHEVARILPPDTIIHLHWVAGFVDYRAFFKDVRGRTIFWTLHDMNPFTGGCHFDNGCGRFSSTCGLCPQLGSTRENDLSRDIWQRKHRALNGIGPEGLHLICPTRWLASAASRSSLLGSRPCNVIPCGLDTETFKPANKLEARKKLGLPENAHIVLFVADSIDNQRKGYEHFLTSLTHLRTDDSLFLLSVGANPAPLPDAFRARHLGTLNDDREIATAYNAADIFAMPSLADNLPNTIMESLACGTPVVAYASGGIPELVEPMETGLLVTTGDTLALAQGIQRMLQDAALREHCSKTGRTRMVERHSVEKLARQYIELYAKYAPAHN